MCIRDSLYIDVGGGSTELNFFENGKKKYEKSFNIGTIRLLNGLVKDDQWKEMKEEIRKNINSNHPILAIGSGGNINKIFSMSKTKDGKPMSTAFLKKYYKEMNGLTVAERMTQFNLREDRADVLVPALEIYNSCLLYTSRCV